MYSEKTRKPSMFDFYFEKDDLVCETKGYYRSSGGGLVVSKASIFVGQAATDSWMRQDFNWNT
jgi:hypothetical protein